MTATRTTDHRIYTHLPDQSDGSTNANGKQIDPAAVELPPTEPIDLTLYLRFP